ncbi:MAG: STAS domain-containing protein [Pseudomonadota bacterium]
MADNLIEMKPSRVAVSRIGNRTILTPKESITHLNFEALENRIRQCTEERISEIVLDCKSVPFMDSSALECLLRIHEDMKNRRGVLKIISLNPVCRDIFLAARLVNTLYVYEDIHEAIKDRT